MAAITGLRGGAVVASQGAVASAVGASSTAAALLGHSNTIPAGTLQVGDVITGRATFLVSTDSTPNLTVALANGTTALVTPLSATATGSGLSARAVTMDYEITVRAIGATGTLELVGRVSPVDTAALVPIRAAATVDTTADIVLDTQVTFGTSHATNTCTGEQHVTRRYGRS